MSKVNFGKKKSPLLGYNIFFPQKYGSQKVSYHKMVEYI
jgi:hypothetical protein